MSALQKNTGAVLIAKSFSLRLALNSLDLHSNIVYFAKRS